MLTTATATQSSETPAAAPVPEAARRLSAQIDAAIAAADLFATLTNRLDPSIRNVVAALVHAPMQQFVMGQASSENGTAASTLLSSAAKELTACAQALDESAEALKNISGHGRSAQRFHLAAIRARQASEGLVGL